VQHVGPTTLADVCRSRGTYMNWRGEHFDIINSAVQALKRPDGTVSFLHVVHHLEAKYPKIFAKEGGPRLSHNTVKGW
jgi:hypothetical protein